MRDMFGNMLNNNQCITVKKIIIKLKLVAGYLISFIYVTNFV